MDTGWLAGLALGSSCGVGVAAGWLAGLALGSSCGSERLRRPDVRKSRLTEMGNGTGQNGAIELV